MKEIVNPFDYAEAITKNLPNGLLLNTKADKFNAMVIGWGALGRTWQVPTFTVLVRENRYTKGALDKTGAFTVSVPLNGVRPDIVKICGGRSGHNIDKVQEAGLTLAEPEVNGVPGVQEYPLTLECRVLYAQKQDLSLLPPDIVKEMYPQDVDGTAPMANRDPHTVYVGEIVRAYLLK